MKIRIMICFCDMEYAEKLLNYFNIRYSDNLDLYAFTDCSLLLEQIRQGETPDVIMVDDIQNRQYLLQNKVSDAPVLCISEEHSLAGVPADEIIFKYQRGEMIYKSILNHYAGPVLNRRKDNTNDKQIYCFMSISGGSGASTVAAAFARKLAQEKKTLYLNLEKYGSTDFYFEGEGNYSFEDVLFALKSKRGAVETKLESAVKKSRENVYFFSDTGNANDVSELTIEEWQQLFDSIEQKSDYEAIIMDIPSAQNELLAECAKRADTIYVVADGTEVGNQKFGRYMEALKVYEKKCGMSIISKILLFYNKFSNKTSREIQYKAIKSSGGIPRYEKIPQSEIVEKIAEREELQKLILS